MNEKEILLREKIAAMFQDMAQIVLASIIIPLMGQGTSGTTIVYALLMVICLWIISLVVVML